MASLYRAPAKINLTLEVLARRDDGYHALRSVMVPLDLADELAIERSDAFAFSCDIAGLGGDDNLAVRALRAIGELPAARVTLRKRIPTQAGLGGGSSDAAAVLRAAMEGAFGDCGPVDWLAAARQLGSDVPFFLAGTGALVEGTGERVTPAGALPPWAVLIVKPPAAISTASAYAELDRHPRPSRARSTSASLAALTALQRGDLGEVERLATNDFQEPIAALAPEIATALDALRSAGARVALLAGSGSCTFALAADDAEAQRLAERLELPSTYERFLTRFAATPGWRN
ncbi:MAG TPA: 4-(cytidine 5'-diphospho)-2-C-methyl-D-erythritol kinase [Verrucomicrobiae bacterium]|nr:4-(cytidine 5'-diphospho)-2-C-methyl-D-erythritol kinase [Candidatus Acidoferrales bacterium]HTX60340.1 4-(cytidine 5'-diphospho)-2-C-methyl-D-erythritol kinase [Verrucomicrobiae bacterium]